MAEVIFGTDVIFEIRPTGEVDYFAVACASACSFNFTNELILKTDVNAGLFRKRRARMSDCSISAQGLTTLDSDATTASTFYFLQEGVRRSDLDLRIRFIDQGGTEKQVQGNFVIESLDLSGSAEDFSLFDMTCQGNGGFVMSDVVSPSAGDAPESFSDWWVLAEGATSVSGTGSFGRSFAGKTIIEVDREGIEYDPVSSSPTGRQHSYDGTNVTFDPSMPGNPGGERVFVQWQTV